MGSADLKIITADMQKQMTQLLGDDAKVTVELDCSAAGGADTGSGHGDKEITVTDDYVSDAERLPKQGHPVAKRTTYEKAGAAPFVLAPFVAIVAAFVA